MDGLVDMDPKSRIGRIREVLASPDSEDRRFENAQFFREADAWLSSYCVTRNCPGHIKLLHIKVIRALRDWSRLVGAVREVRWADDRHQARALLELALAYINLQEFAAADRCLGDAVALDASVAPRADRIRKRLDDQLRLDIYGRLSAYLVQTLAAGKMDLSRSIFRSALHAYGAPEDLSECAVDLLAQLDGRPRPWWRLRSRPRIASSPCLGPLITCGSGYSGTGAVTAYFREYNELSMSFGVREISLLKKNYGLHRLLSRWESWTEVQRRDELRQLIMKTVLGIPCYPDPGRVDRVVSRSITWNSLFLGDPLGLEYLSDVKDHVISFYREAAGCRDVAHLEAVSARLIAGILRTGSSKRLLLNNAVHQTQIRLGSVVHGSRIIVVVRDPRDQYVAQQTETRGRRTTVEAFIKKRKRASAAVSECLATGVDNVKVVLFEDFVRDRSVRGDLSAWADVSGAEGRCEGRFFDPAQSAKNVGIYRKWPLAPEIELIEAELGHECLDL